MVAFSGRHAEQSVWVLTQKYTSVLKGLREQTRWVCFTAKTAIPSKTVCVKMKWSPHENSGCWCGSSLPRRSMLNSCWRLISLLVIQCLAMLSNNEVTEGLLISVLGANFVLLCFVAWHVATARLYFRQVHRLAIAIVRKNWLRRTDWSDAVLLRRNGRETTLRRNCWW